MEWQPYYTIWHVVYIGIMIPTVLGNGFLILCVLKYRRLRSNMHVLITNLAVSDFIVGAILIPFDMLSDIYRWKTNKYVCLGVFAIFVVSLGSSCYNLLLISIERFIAIVYPLRAKSYLTRPRMIFMITFGWVVALINGSIPLYENSYTNSTTECLIEFVWTKGYRVNSDWQLLIALILDFVFYAIVVCIALRKSKREPNAIGNDLNIHRRARKDFHQLITMVIVLGMFMLCWLPYVCLSVVVTIWDTPYFHYIKRCCLIPGLINSGINWIIYGYRKKEFQRAFKALIKCSRSLPRDTSSTIRITTIGN